MHIHTYYYYFIVLLYRLFFCDNDVKIFSNELNALYRPPEPLGCMAQGPGPSARVSMPAQLVQRAGHSGTVRWPGFAWEPEKVSGKVKVKGVVWIPIRIKVLVSIRTFFHPENSLGLVIMTSTVSLNSGSEYRIQCKLDFFVKFRVFFRWPSQNRSRYF